MKVELAGQQIGGTDLQLQRERGQPGQARAQNTDCAGARDLKQVRTLGLHRQPERCHRSAHD